MSGGYPSVLKGAADGVVHTLSMLQAVHSSEHAAGSTCDTSWLKAMHVKCLARVAVSSWGGGVSV